MQSRTHALLVALLAAGPGCKERERSQPQAVMVPKPVVDPAAARRATTKSVARRDWPCRITATGSDGTAVEIAIRYAERETCTIPIEKHAVGVTGCVLELTGSVRENGVVRSATERFTYMGEALEDSAPAMLVWENGLVVGHGTAGTLAAPYALTPRGVKFTRGDMTVDMVIENGKLLARNDTVGAQSERMQLTWQGDRLVRIDKVRTDPAITIAMELAYDCADGP